MAAVILGRDLKLFSVCTGETALQSNAPRNATLIAAVGCLCLQLSRNDFQELIGDVDDLRAGDDGAGGITPRAAQAKEQQDLEASEHIMTFFDDDLSLGDFERGALLGRGSYGQVVHAKHKVDGGYYALKCLSKIELVRNGQVPHLMNEKEVLQAVHHPGLVNLEGVFQDERFVYFVLEYVVGGELYTHTSEVGKLSDDDSRFYTCQIVEALSYMVSEHLLFIRHLCLCLLAEARGPRWFRWSAQLLDDRCCARLTPVWRDTGYCSMVAASSSAI